MSRIRPRSSNSVSLFPFLAVLVCAMGALILLLLVTTRRIRSEAIAQAKQQTEASSSVGVSHAAVPERFPVDDAAPIEDPDVALRELLRRLQQQQDENRRRRERLNREFELAQQSQEASSAQLARLRRQMQDARTEQAEYDLLRQSLAERSKTLAQDVESARARLREVEQAGAAAEAKFMVVPFDGGRGTARRPILIECSDQGLRFLPEDVLLTMDDLVGSTTMHNPLLSGTRALVDHWTDVDRNNADGNDAEPYVLLIVRPSGVLAHVAARNLLQRFDRPFGYELVLEDWQLELPQQDPQAVAKLEAALERAVAQRRPAARGGGLPGRQGSPGGERHGFYEETLEDILNRTYADPLVAGKTGRGERSFAHPPSGNTSQQRTAERPPSVDQSMQQDPDRSGNSANTAEQIATQPSRAQSPSRPPTSPEDLAPSRPDVQAFRNRWNPTGRRSGIGFEREVKIRVDADRLVVGRGQTIHVGRGETRDELLQDVLQAISAETQAWGPPPDKFYWVPTVRFLISPGGNQHYERLRHPLEKFGFSSRAEFVLDASNDSGNTRR